MQHNKYYVAGIYISLHRKEFEHMANVNNNTPRLSLNFNQTRKITEGKEGVKQEEESSIAKDSPALKSVGIQAQVANIIPNNRLILTYNGITINKAANSEVQAANQTNTTEDTKQNQASETENDIDEKNIENPENNKMNTNVSLIRKHAIAYNNKYSNGGGEVNNSSNNGLHISSYGDYINKHFNRVFPGGQDSINNCKDQEATCAGVVIVAFFDWMFHGFN